MFHSQSPIRILEKLYSPGVAFLLLLIISIAVWIARSYINLRHIPGPLWASLTNFPRLLWVRRGNAHDTHIELHRKYGRLVRFGPNMVSVSDPAEISHIYGVNGRFKKSSFYWVLSFYIKGKAIPGLFATQDENLHRILRRPISGIYSMSNLVSFEPYVDSTMRVFFEQLDKRFVKSDEVCQFDTWLQMFAFDVIGEITFSKRLGFLERGEDVDGIMEKSWKYFCTAAVVSQMPWLDYIWTKNPILQRLRVTKLNPIVAFARARRQERSLEPAKEFSSEVDDRKRDFLTRFLEVESNDPATPPWATNAWATSNITAGSDTTAILLRTIFYSLLKHPRSLKTLRTELDARTDLDELVTWKQGITLQYLDACIKEAGRLHPPFGLPYERVVPPEGATICGQRLPGGTIVGISAWVVHRDYEVFGVDSDVWRPERWIECDVDKRRGMENALFTFGAGARSCIGKNISYLEIYKLVPTLLRLYDLEFFDPQETNWHVTNRWFTNQTDFNVRLKKRTLKPQLNRAASGS